MPSSGAFLNPNVAMHKENTERLVQIDEASLYGGEAGLHGSERTNGGGGKAEAKQAADHYEKRYSRSFLLLSCWLFVFIFR